MSASEDELAVDRVLAGDTSAFERIVERWQGPLVNLAYRFCRDRARAEDMAQEAFILVFRKLSSWRRQALFSTWLFALATNLFRTEIRRIPPILASRNDLSELMDPHDIDEAAEIQNRAEHVQRALLSLPGRYRDALILFYFHDLDVAQAAQSLGVPTGTVKARLSRGREILARKLAATFGTEVRGGGHEQR